MAILGGCPVPIGFYVATFRCEFEFHQIRAGYLLWRKVYEVANLVDMKLATARTSEIVQRQPGVIAPPLTAEQIEFRFRDGKELTLSAFRISVDPEALYHLLRRHYSHAQANTSEQS